jgi:hypothetical protein
LSEASSFSAICVTPCAAPATVGLTLTRANAGCWSRHEASSTTGSTSATPVPAYPPSPNDRGPPSISNPPPRRSSNSAIIFY